MQIIKNGAIVEDAFVHLASDAQLPADGDVIRSSRRSRSSRSSFRPSKTGAATPQPVCCAIASGIEVRSARSGTCCAIN